MGPIERGDGKTGSHPYRYSGEWKKVPLGACLLGMQHQRFLAPRHGVPNLKENPQPASVSLGTLGYHYLHFLYTMRPHR